jgi:hypothetical protein
MLRGWPNGIETQKQIFGLTTGYGRFTLRQRMGELCGLASSSASGPIVGEEGQQMGKINWILGTVQYICARSLASSHSHRHLHRGHQHLSRSTTSSWMSACSRQIKAKYQDQWQGRGHGTGRGSVLHLNENTVICIDGLKTSAHQSWQQQPRGHERTASRVSLRHPDQRDLRSNPVVDTKVGSRYELTPKVLIGRQALAPVLWLREAPRPTR